MKREAAPGWVCLQAALTDHRSWGRQMRAHRSSGWSWLRYPAMARVRKRSQSALSRQCSGVGPQQHGNVVSTEVGLQVAAFHTAKAAIPIMTGQHGAASRKEARRPAGVLPHL